MLRFIYSKMREPTFNTYISYNIKNKMIWIMHLNFAINAFYYYLLRGTPLLNVKEIKDMRYEDIDLAIFAFYSLGLIQTQGVHLFQNYSG